MATRRILLVAVSMLLLSFSGVLFSTSLILGKALESHGRTDQAALLRANDRYWHLFPFQLIAIAIVGGIVVVFILNSAGIRPNVSPKAEAAGLPTSHASLIALRLRIWHRRAKRLGKHAG